LKTAVFTLTLLTLLCACGTTATSLVADIPLSEQPLAGKFVWHDLMTDDLEAARTFYSGLLGWTFEETRHPNGGDYTLILSDGQLVGGMVQLADPEGAEYSRWVGYLSVPDVDSAADFTVAEGGTVVAGPLDLPGIGRAAAIQDPQGGVVGLLRSNPGDPADSVVPGVGQVVWNEMLAADEKAAAAFYERISGARVKAVERRGGEYIVLQSQERDRAGFMARPAEDVDPFWLTHIGVADPAAAASRVSALGGEVLLPPSADLRDGTLAVVIDPNGAILALQQWNH
jgi:predicted enzyme related to lactoylglutathione lyase